MLLLAILSVVAFAKLEDGRMLVTLNNRRKMSLVGIGIGNMQHDAIEKSVLKAIDSGVRVIDTAHSANNEHILGKHEVLSPLLHRMSDQDPVTVITKVWYTHLGYERTKLSVLESMKRMGRGSIEVVLLHWPKCDTEKNTWMQCKKEEKELEDHVKEVTVLESITD